MTPPIPIIYSTEGLDCQIIVVIIIIIIVLYYC
jgi:uncharacterized membrane protein